MPESYISHIKKDNNRLLTAAANDKQLLGDSFRDFSNNQGRDNRYIILLLRTLQLISNIS